MEVGLQECCILTAHALVINVLDMQCNKQIIHYNITTLVLGLNCSYCL